MTTAKHRITVTLDDDEYQRLSRIANKFGKSLSWVANYAIKGLTKEVGTKQFVAFRQWTLEQPAEGKPPTASVVIE